MPITPVCNTGVSPSSCQQDSAVLKARNIRPASCCASTLETCSASRSATDSFIKGHLKSGWEGVKTVSSALFNAVGLPWFGLMGVIFAFGMANVDNPGKDVGLGGKIAAALVYLIGIPLTIILSIALLPVSIIGGIGILITMGLEKLFVGKIQ